MRLDCEECEREVELDKCKTGLDILPQFIPEKIERHYLECPNCQHKYTSYYLTEELKQLQAEIRIIRKKAVNSPLKTKQKNRITKLERQLTFRHEQLKDRVEHPVKKAVEKDG